VNTFKDVAVIVEENKTYSPKFEYPAYSVSLLDSTPVGSVILTMRYKAHSTDIIKFNIEQISNLQINNFFELRQSQSFQTISVIVNTSPIINDKPDLSFSISIKSMKNNLFLNISSTTIVNINLLTSFTVSNYPKFQQPLMPNEQIFIDLKSFVNNSIIYQLKAANTNRQSLILYRIVNKVKLSMFYLESNNIHILLPIEDKRNNFLVNFLTLLIPSSNLAVMTKYF
jgi:hypothetical protein